MIGWPGMSASTGGQAVLPSPRREAVGAERAAAPSAGRGAAKSPQEPTRPTFAQSLGEADRRLEAARSEGGRSEKGHPRGGEANKGEGGDGQTGAIEKTEAPQTDAEVAGAAGREALQQAEQSGQSVPAAPQVIDATADAEVVNDKLAGEVDETANDEEMVAAAFAEVHASATAVVSPAEDSAEAAKALATPVDLRQAKATGGTAMDGKAQVNSAASPAMEAAAFAGEAGAMSSNEEEGEAGTSGDAAKREGDAEAVTSAKANGSVASARPGPTAAAGAASATATGEAAVAPTLEAGAPHAAARPVVTLTQAAAPTAMQGESDPAADADAQLNAARVARGLQNALNQRGGTVTLRLTPAEMGTVRIQLQIQGGTVAAQFHTETEAAGTLLNQQFTQLRQALESQGLAVERLTVQTMQPSSPSSTAQQQADGSAHDGRSRGEYRDSSGRGSQDTPQDGRGDDGQPRRRWAGFAQVLNETG